MKILEHVKPRTDKKGELVIVTKKKAWNTRKNDKQARQ